MEPAYDVTTAVGLVNTASLVFAAGWGLCARQAWIHRSPLATFAATHLAVLTPIFYLSLPFEHRLVYSLSSAWCVLFYNIAFVTMGMLLVGRDLETWTEGVLFCSFVYGVAGCAGVLVMLAHGPDGSSDDSSSSVVEAYYFVEPAVNAACLMWFVMISFYRYAACCISGHDNYLVLSRWAALFMQLTLTVLVFSEKALLYMARDDEAMEVTWRAVHWARATATQGWLYLLASRSRRSAVTFVDPRDGRP